MKFFKKKINSLIERYSKVWGATIETNLPPEFVITDHAHRRIEERLQCNKEKVMKVTVKAWNNKETLDQRFIQEKERCRNYNRNNIRYKTFNGFVFVFALKFIKSRRLENRLGFSQKILVTVYPKISDFY